MIDFFSGFADTIGWCETWRNPQHWLFQLANICFFISYAAPSNRIGLVLMHSVLVLGEKDCFLKMEFKWKRLKGRKHYCWHLKIIHFRFHVVFWLGVECCLCSWCFFMEFSIYVFKPSAIVLYYLFNEAGEIWSRIGGCLSHVISAFQSKSKLINNN